MLARPNMSTLTDANGSLSKRIQMMSTRHAKLLTITW